MVNYLSIAITSAGLLYSLYLLISTKFNTKDKACTSCLCFFGIGWMFLLLQTIKDPLEGYVTIGSLFLLLGFIMWSRNQLYNKETLCSLLKR